MFSQRRHDIDRPTKRIPYIVTVAHVDIVSHGYEHWLDESDSDSELDADSGSNIEPGAVARLDSHASRHSEPDAV